MKEETKGSRVVGRRGEKRVDAGIRELRSAGGGVEALPMAATAAGKDAVRRWQLSALAGLASALLTAGLIGQFAFDAAWGSPLSDLVWSFDALMLVETIAALLFAIVLGTPGCEIGVWPELIARARGTRFEPAQWPACLVGLHYLDEWEARHHPRRDRRSTTTRRPTSAP